MPVNPIGRVLTIIACMIVGLLTILALFMLRIVALIACVIGGMALLSAILAAGTYSHAPTRLHWLGLVHTTELAAVSIVVVIIGWFGPMFLFQDRGASPAPRHAHQGMPAQLPQL